MDLKTKWLSLFQFLLKTVSCRTNVSTPQESM